jgi:hypothetical protein
MDFAAVRLDVPPIVTGMIDVADVLQRLAMGCPFILGPDLLQLHAQKRLTAVAVMLDRRVVDLQELRGFRVEYPHRHRVVVEQQAERHLARLSAVTSDTVSDSMSPNAVIPSLKLRSSLPISNCPPLPPVTISRNRSSTSGAQNRLPPAPSRRHNSSVAGRFKSREAP